MTGSQAAIPKMTRFVYTTPKIGPGVILVIQYYLLLMSSP